MRPAPLALAVALVACVVVACSSSGSPTTQADASRFCATVPTDIFTRKTPTRVALTPKQRQRDLDEKKVMAAAAPAAVRADLRKLYDYAVEFDELLSHHGYVLIRLYQNAQADPVEEAKLERVLDGSAVAIQRVLRYVQSHCPDVKIPALD